MDLRPDEVAPLPLAPEPDDKNWTWVIERPCPDCGFDGSAHEPTATAAVIRTNAAAWVEQLTTRPDVRTRPEPAVWSALEYGCHVRDVYRLYEYRLSLIEAESPATFPNWDQDETAITQRYDLQDPAVVAGELATAAESLAARFESVTDWSRVGLRSDGAAFTTATFSQYLVHDPIHHLWDIRVERS